VNPTLSVCVIAFNHARYIGECLESIVSQEADFRFEVIVGDDCSTDGTVTIIDEYAARYPDIVRVIKHVRNVGGTDNMLSVHNAATGEFVAHMDGDDCMLPGKLQQQVDFLRAHMDHALVAHDVEIIDEHSNRIASTFGSVAVPETATLDYLVSRGCYFAHSSKVYRRTAARSTHRDRPTVDLFFHIEQALSGLVGYIDRPLGQYRKTGAGLSSIRSAFQREVLLGHLDAYEYALQSGVSPEIVIPARLRFRYVNAMNCIRAGRLSEFRMLASATEEELRWATVRERLVLRAPARAVYLASIVFDYATQQRRFAR